MTLTNEDLVAAIEGSFFTFPHVPGFNNVLSIPGVQGHYGPIPSPELNMIGDTRLTDENVGATIEQVKDIARRENTIMGWLVTPNSRPEDLTDHLTAAGFTAAGEAAGMVLTDLDPPIRVNPAFRIREATREEFEAAVPVIVRSYGMPPEAEAVIGPYFAALQSGGIEYPFYLASPEGSEEPVAWAATLFLPGKPIVVLQGAGTLPEYRGQGIYSTFVAYRLKVARERGIEAAVIQANRATSAPIAEKLGFQEVLPMTIYAWSPPAEE